MKDLFITKPQGVLIAPSVLAADFGNLSAECRGVLAQGAELLHVDIMDGHFVPNLSMGPAVVEGLCKACPDGFLDVHLMVTDPASYVDSFTKAGADHLSVHIEVLKPADARELASKIHAAGITAGIVINPGTNPANLLEVMDAFDLVLVMGVMPGFGGQSFIEDCLKIVPEIRDNLRESQRLEIDGGVGLGNAPRLIEAGFDVLVAGSSVFGVDPAERGQRISSLRNTR